MASKRDEQKARTRDAVITAARELFHHHGYDSVTIRQIAKKAGMSTGAIYAGFEDKAILFEAAMGEPAPDVEAFMRQVVTSASLAIEPHQMRSALDQLAIEAERLRRHLHGNHA